MENKEIISKCKKDFKFLTKVEELMGGNSRIASAVITRKLGTKPDKKMVEVCNKLRVFIKSEEFDKCRKFISKEQKKIMTTLIKAEDADSK